MRGEVILSCSIIAALVLGSTFEIVQEGQPPPMPMALYGFVTVDGSPAPDGTQVSAQIGGREYARATTSGVYGPGYYSLVVPADDPATPDDKEGGVDNEAVELYVGRVKVAEVRYERGGIRRLDLAVPGVPAEFILSDLSIVPTWTQAGRPVIISVIVRNWGDLSGTYTVVLKLNGVVKAFQQVTLAGGASASLTFGVVENVAGTYNVEVDGLTGSFTLTEAPPPPELKPAEFVIISFLVTPTEVEIGEKVRIIVVIKNIGELEGSHTLILKVDGVTEATSVVTLAGGASQEVTFTVARNREGTYQVQLDGLTATFKVRSPPPHLRGKMSSQLFRWRSFCLGLPLLRR